MTGAFKRGSVATERNAEVLCCRTKDTQGLDQTLENSTIPLPESSPCCTCGCSKWFGRPRPMMPRDLLQDLSSRRLDRPAACQPRIWTSALVRHGHPLMLATLSTSALAATRVPIVAPVSALHVLRLAPSPNHLCPLNAACRGAPRNDLRRSLARNSFKHKFAHDHPRATQNVTTSLSRMATSLSHLHP